MDRYDTLIEDDTLYIETGDGDLEVGPMSVIVDHLGETYTLEYDEEVKMAGWLQTDEDATITFDVRETITDLDFDERFVRRMARESLDRETADGVPERTVAFAELMEEIWESKGTFEFD